jgi:hypothetical protein
MLGYGLAVMIAALVSVRSMGNALPAEDRLWVDAKINGQPVQLIFDTGTGFFGLYSQTARRLGLVYTKADENIKADPGQVILGCTEACNVQIGTNVLRVWLGVIEHPAMLSNSVDGIIGWPNMSNNILRIEADRGRITSLNEVPPAATDWTQCKLVAGADMLRLEMKQPRRAAITIFVDTGNENGVKLAPELWQAWKREHAQQPLTMNAYHTPAVGLVVTEEGWASALPVGTLLLRDVPVCAADKADLLHGTITFGMAALKRLDVIVDGKHGVAYLHPKETPPPPYKHNRLGAIFMPQDLQHEDLLAHVAPATPAWEAGIRDGDALLRIGTLDATKWRTDPEVLPLTRFWSRPAGTKHQLTLRRGPQEYQVEVVLRDILTPKSTTPASPKPSLPLVLQHLVQ